MVAAPPCQNFFFQYFSESANPYPLRVQQAFGNAAFLRVPFGGPTCYIDSGGGCANGGVSRILAGTVGGVFIVNPLPFFLPSIQYRVIEDDAIYAPVGGTQYDPWTPTPRPVPNVQYTPVLLGPNHVPEFDSATLQPGRRLTCQLFSTGLGLVSNFLMEFGWGARLCSRT